MISFDLHECVGDDAPAPGAGALVPAGAVDLEEVSAAADRNAIELNEWFEQCIPQYSYLTFQLQNIMLMVWRRVLTYKCFKFWTVPENLSQYKLVPSTDNSSLACERFIKIVHGPNVFSK